jgi:murein DD-endopeptidase MepM/ murein hydrolase activator NlpD
VNSDSKSEPWLRRTKQFFAKRTSLIAAGAALTAGIFAATLTYLETNRTKASAAVQTIAIKPNALPLETQNLRWGFFMDEYTLSEKQLQRGDVLGAILMEQAGLSYPQVNKLVESCKDKFKINSLRVGSSLRFLSRQAGQAPEKMIYEPSPYQYTVFNLKAPYEVEVIKRDVQTEIVAASGVLETSFWQALTDNGLSDELADGMIDVLASSVDFYHQKQGDRFKVVFEQHYIQGQAVGTGKIIAAVYAREGKESYAFHFQKEGQKTDYYDFEGRPARKAFLKAPVKVSRISSRFNMNRLHPILGYHKAHLGTDYAAPHGTPIIAVAEGTILEATRRGGNGNFVRIRHDGAYETQYLHMSGFARGIRPGTRVAQGQTIGYVGSTGLATGPHVCFRFWKNGRQVDHLRLNLPQPLPITGQLFEEYKIVRDDLVKLLNSVPYHTHEELSLETNSGDKLMKVTP